ncbi:hypothetical protein [Reyranella sp.]|uniref:hypothetical protein n=1 Tax=Reyranella sp. TaxID=1929291 RepID=UPI0011FF6BDC|nr:hypothetical protein [Reyranella sp.]TAJ84613.1 MAG: hypothetical protein EPO50_18170 [Reyranella sp.]
MTSSRRDRKSNDRAPARPSAKDAAPGERESRAKRLDRSLEVALEDSFPCSDPLSSLRFD